VAFFFCDYKDDKTHLPVNILAALASQLAIQKDGAYSALANYYQQLHPARQLPKHPTVDGLKSTLAKMLGEYDRTYLIVDGLDECGRHVDEVVATIASWSENHERLSIALLSRNEPNIRRRLGDEYDEIEIAAHTADIAEYVTAQIEERIRTRSLRIHDPLLKDEIIQRLTEGAAGM
jgi:hypothetical protein